jgi:benzoate-CoA ligase family protein
MITTTPNIPDIFNLSSYLVDRHITEGRGNRTVIYYGEKTITYAELAATVNRTGNMFKNLGVDMEDRVIMVLPDSPEFFYCFLGAMKIGAVAVAVNTLGIPKDYTYFLNDSRAKVLVVHESLLPKIEPVKDELKYLKNIVVVGASSTRYHNFDNLIKEASDVLEPASTSKDDVAFWMYTSGTTGVPKGVVHLHHDMLYFAPPCCRNVSQINENDRVFTTSKMFFSYGRNNSFDYVLMYGASVVLFPDWPDPRKVFQVLEKYHPTILVSVPSFYSAMLREIEKEGGPKDLSFIRACTSSGEPLPKGIFDRWKARFGLEILDVLGSTDAGGSYLGNPPGRSKPGSAGTLLDGWEGQLLDPEGCEVSDGNIGTLWLKNDGTAPYYWNKHERSKQVFKGDWFNTGDLFHRDADGYYWVEGREDEMLKVSGQWVSPLEIEGALSQHPAVMETAVVGSPDEIGLVRPKAFVVLKDSTKASPELEKELINFVRDRIAHFKTPRWIEFTKEMPRTVTGKLQRHKLK